MLARLDGFAHAEELHVLLQPEVEFQFTLRRRNQLCISRIRPVGWTYALLP